VAIDSITQPTCRPSLYRPYRPLCQAGDYCGQFCRLNRLGYVHLKTRRKHAEPVLRSSISSQCRSGDRSSRLRAAKAHSTYELVAVDVGHPDISDQYIRSPMIHNLECLARAVGLSYFCLSMLQHGSNNLARSSLIIDYKDS
jgi:hypothetical protein